MARPASNPLCVVIAKKDVIYWSYYALILFPEEEFSLDKLNNSSKGVNEALGILRDKGFDFKKYQRIPTWIVKQFLSTEFLVKSVYSITRFPNKKERYIVNGS